MFENGKKNIWEGHYIILMLFFKFIKESFKFLRTHVSFAHFHDTKSY